MKKFDEYFSAVKKLRTKDSYRYTDEELEKYSGYFKDCWKQNLSYYKALEWLYFENIRGKTKI